MTEETKLRERSASKALNMTMPKDFEMNMDIWQTNAVDETGSQRITSTKVVSEIDGGSVSKPRNVFKASSLQQAQEPPTASAPSTQPQFGAARSRRESGRINLKTGPG